MEIKNHILKDIKFLKSPNFNERPRNIEISLLIIHSISLPPKKYNTDHIEKFFMNELDIKLDDFYKEIDGFEDLNLSELDGCNRISITAGASAPEEKVQEIASELQKYTGALINESGEDKENIFFKLPPLLR